MENKKSQGLQLRDLSSLLKRFGLLFVLILMFLVMTIVSDVFLTTNNIINVLRQISINGVLAVGLTFVILTGGIDLSVGSLVAVTSVIAGNLLEKEMNVPLVLFSASAPPFCSGCSTACSSPTSCCRPLSRRWPPKP